MRKERLKSITLSKVEGTDEMCYTGLEFSSFSEANVRINKDEPAPDTGHFRYDVILRFHDGYLVSDYYEHIKGKWPDMGNRFVTQFNQILLTSPSPSKRREAGYVLDHYDFEK